MTQTTRLYASLSAACRDVLSGREPAPGRQWCAERVAVQRTATPYLHQIVVWRTPSVLDAWYHGPADTNLLGILRYRIDAGRVHIERLTVNDGEHRGRPTAPPTALPLAYDDARRLRQAFLRHVILVAKVTAKPVITLDVYYTLQQYHRHYVKEGFLVTGRQSEGNSPYWFEAELTVDDASYDAQRAAEVDL